MPTTTYQRLIEKAKRGELINICFFGDSNTSSEWVQPNWRTITDYVIKQDLCNHVHWKVAEWNTNFYNCGYDGASTRDYLHKIDYVLSLKPDLVILKGGDNDRIFNISSQEHGDNWGKIFERFNNASVELITHSSIPNYNEPINETYQEYKSAHEQAADDHNISFFDLYTPLLEQFQASRDIFCLINNDGNPDENIEPGSLDDSHPGRLGHALISQIILRQVFGIDFDPHKYLETLDNNIMFPEYQ